MNTKRITAIDGLRAVAITLVLLRHVIASPGAPDFLGAIMRFASPGVTAFWVLSGFLITRSLLNDEARTGAIRFRAFYSRQSIRFFLPMLGYLLLVTSWLAFRYPAYAWWSFLRPLVLDPNTYCIAQGVTHLYSMVLQIYFWLAWPVVLKLTPRNRRLLIAILLALLALAWKIYGRDLAESTGTCAGRVDYYFMPLLVGACFALAESRLVALVTANANRFAALAVATLIFAPGVTVIYPMSIFAASVPVAVAWGILIFSLAHRIFPVADRALSFPPLVWLGRISFSVYLWQNIFCFGLTETKLDLFPLNLIASIVCGYIAYRLIELPSLRWRSRLKRNSAIAPAPA